jgi:hypothetical protein
MKIRLELSAEGTSLEDLAGLLVSASEALKQNAGNASATRSDGGNFHYQTMVYDAPVQAPPPDQL